MYLLARFGLLSFDALNLKIIVVGKLKLIVFQKGLVGDHLERIRLLKAEDLRKAVRKVIAQTESVLIKGVGIYEEVLPEYIAYPFFSGSVVIPWFPSVLVVGFQELALAVSVDVAFPSVGHVTNEIRDHTPVSVMLKEIVNASCIAASGITTKVEHKLEVLGSVTIKIVKPNRQRITEHTYMAVKLNELVLVLDYGH